MSFIGIIADSKNAIIIEKVLDYRLNIPNKKYTIIIINDKSIDNIRNIKFETILIMEIKGLSDKESLIRKILKNTKYLVINADVENILDITNNMKLNVITFGFNQKATITASSVEEDFIFCVQRKIVGVSGNIIEPQEKKAEIIEKKLINNTHNSIGIATILLIYGKNEIKF